MSAATELKLYEWTDQYLEVVNEVVEAGGELTPELEARLEGIEAGLKEKVERVALVVRNLEAVAKGYDEEAARLKAQARARERSAKSLKEYLRIQLATAGLDVVEGERAKVRLQKNSAPSVQVTVHPEKLPPRFRQVKVDADKKKLLKAWKDGRKIPDGVKVEYGSHVRIY